MILAESVHDSNTLQTRRHLYPSLFAPDSRECLTRYPVGGSHLHAYSGPQLRHEAQCRTPCTPGRDVKVHHVHSELAPPVHARCARVTSGARVSARRANFALNDAHQRARRDGPSRLALELLLLAMARSLSSERSSRTSIETVGTPRTASMACTVGCRCCQQLQWYCQPQ